jgi:hypothetical protein
MVQAPQLLDYLLLIKQQTNQLHRLLIQYQFQLQDLIIHIGSMYALM